MVEQPLLGWAGRFAYLSAKHEKTQIELYGMDLLWLIAKTKYNGLKQPSEIAFTQKRTDSRSGKKIVEDLIKGLGGE